MILKEDNLVKFRTLYYPPLIRQIWKFGHFVESRKNDIHRVAIRQRTLSKTLSLNSTKNSFSCGLPSRHVWFWRSNQFFRFYFRPFRWRTYQFPLLLHFALFRLTFTISGYGIRYQTGTWDERNFLPWYLTFLEESKD